MRLDEFICQSLSDIATGVSNVQLREGQANRQGAVNPFFVDDPNHNRRDLIQDIKFDIAVSVSESTSQEGGGRLTILNIASAGAESGSETESGQVNRIQFSIPILLPISELHDRKVDAQ